MITTRIAALALGCTIGLAATSQNIFFSEYGQANGGPMYNAMRCANGDFISVDETWHRMMRTDSLGNVLWANRSVPSMYVRADAPVEAANGDLLVLGGAYDTATTQYNMALVRMDAQGNVLSADAFPVDTLTYFPWRSAPLNNGMIAHIATALNAQEVVIMVFDPTGPYAYPRIRIPVNFQLQGNSPAGFTGVFAGPGPYFFAYHGSYQPAFIFSKYTTSGVALWSKSYMVDSSYTAVALAGTKLASGDLALLVQAWGINTDGTYVLLLDPAGEVISARRLDHPDYAFDLAGHVVPMPDGSFVVHPAHAFADPNKGDMLLHMDANADIIAQYSFSPGGYVDDVIAVDNDRLMVLNNANNVPILSLMDLNTPLPACWVPDSMIAVPVVASAISASFTSSTYMSPPLPVSVTTLPIALLRAPFCGNVGMETSEPSRTLALFPSPSPDGRITVQGEGVEPGNRYEVFNAQGLRCAEGSLPADARLDLAWLAPGSYVLRLFAAGGLRTVRLAR